MRTLALAPICLIALLAVTGCGSGATTNCKLPPDRALLLAVRAHADTGGKITLPNGNDKGNASRLTISACQTSATEATATLTVFGMTDPSVRDLRHGVKLERRNGTWEVTGDAHTQRCQPGHGSQEFSSDKCH
jgi:hypothetical protein